MKRIAYFTLIVIIFTFVANNSLLAQCLEYKLTTSSETLEKKPYYNDLFNDSTLRVLDKYKRTIGTTDSKLIKSKAKLNTIQTKYANSDKLSKKEYKKLKESKENALYEVIKLYKTIVSNKIGKYNTYLENLSDVRMDSEPKNAKEGNGYERNMQNFYRQVVALKKQADKANITAKKYKKKSDDRAKHLEKAISLYQKADPLQNDAILNIENAFQAYKDDSPSHRSGDEAKWMAYEKFLAKEDSVYTEKIEILLDGKLSDKNKTPFWIEKINREYKDYKKNITLILTERDKNIKRRLEIKELKEKWKKEENASKKLTITSKIETIEGLIRKSEANMRKYNTYLERNEEDIVELLARQIDIYKDSTATKFKNFNEKFVYFDLENKTIVREKRKILDLLNKAKKDILKAGFANECARARLKVYYLLLNAEENHKKAGNKFKDFRNTYDIKSEFYKPEIKLNSECGGGKTAKTSTKTRNNNNSRNNNKPNYSGGSTRDWRYSNTKGVKYKVQILAQTNVPTSSAFKGLYPISSENLGESTLKAYLVGSTTSMFTAGKTLKKAKQKGFKDAYIVAYFKGKRIPLWEAEDIIKGIIKEPTTESNTGNTYNKPLKGIVFKKLENLSGITYTVQVAYSKNTPTAQELEYLSPVYKYKYNGIYRYSVGLFRDFKSADKESTRIKNKGITDAFVTAYENGKPIDLQKAIKKQR